MAMTFEERMQAFFAQKPSIHPTAFVAPTAAIMGHVTLEEESSVWYNTVLRGDIMKKLMHITSADLVSTCDVQMAGAFFAGSSNNGAHAANALAAMFIATGQDAANIAESHAAITYTRELPNGDFYWSITLPALIVATYGGGTGLATQRECLEMLGCYGLGKVHKFAEICAAVVLDGETSLVSAILHGDWVSAHEKMGRNRP